MSNEKLEERSLPDLLATLELQAWTQGFFSGRDGYDPEDHQNFEVLLDKVKIEILRRFS